MEMKIHGMFIQPIYAKGSLGTDVLCPNTGWVGDGTWEELTPMYTV